MSVYEPTRPMDRCPSHPGALLDDIIPATGKTRVEIANLLGISRQQLYDIIREKKPVSPAVAARLGKMFGDGAAIWLRCRPLMMPGTRSAKWMSAPFQRCMPPET